MAGLFFNGFQEQAFGLFHCHPGYALELRFLLDLYRRYLLRFCLKFGLSVLKAAFLLVHRFQPVLKGLFFLRQSSL